jgi:hypothetical protein
MNAIKKASKSCKNPLELVPDHFVGITKVAVLSSGLVREINGIAFTQTYFSA